MSSIVLHMTDDILYPSHIAWRVSWGGVGDIDEIWGLETSKRVAKAKERLAAAAVPYRFVVGEMTNEWLDRFVPLYEEYIGAKENGTVFDIRNKITTNQAVGKKYEAISLWQGDVFLGGVIYSLGVKALHVAYRVFPRQLDIKLPISCSYVAEDYLYRRAFELQKHGIVHGKDRNPYGINSAIGLAEYKLKVGCAPWVSQSEAVVFSDATELRADQEALVFLGKEKGIKITEAILFSDRSPEELHKIYGVLFSQSAVQVRLEKPQT